LILIGSSRFTIFCKNGFQFQIYIFLKNNSGGQGLLIYGGEREDNLEEGIHTVNWKRVSDI